MKVKLEVYRDISSHHHCRRRNLGEQKISIRRISVDDDLSYDGLLSFLTDMLNSMDKNLSKNSILKVQFMDEEQDWIDIFNKDEWEEAKQIYKSKLANQSVPLKLKCIVELKKQENKENVSIGASEHPFKRHERHRMRRHNEFAPFGKFISQIFFEDDDSDKKEEKKKEESQAHVGKHPHCMRFGPFEHQRRKCGKWWRESNKAKDDTFQSIFDGFKDACEQTREPLEKTLLDVINIVFSDGSSDEKKKPQSNPSPKASTSGIKTNETVDNVQRKNEETKEVVNKDVKEDVNDKASIVATEEKEIKPEENFVNETQQDEPVETTNSLSSSFVDLTESGNPVKDDDVESDNEFDDVVVVDYPTKSLMEEQNKSSSLEEEEQNIPQPTETTTEVKEQHEEIKESPEKVEETKEETVEQFKEEIEVLETMGFNNAKLNRQLLSFYKGDMNTVLNTLLKL